MSCGVVLNKNDQTDTHGLYSTFFRNIYTFFHIYSRLVVSILMLMCISMTVIIHCLTECLVFNFSAKFC